MTNQKCCGTCKWLGLPMWHPPNIKYCRNPKNKELNREKGSRAGSKCSDWEKKEDKQ